MICYNNRIINDNKNTLKNDLAFNELSVIDYILSISFATVFSGKTNFQLLKEKNQHNIKQ